MMSLGTGRAEGLYKPYAMAKHQGRGNLSAKSIELARGTGLVCGIGWSHGFGGD
jgi:hypothetical protein